MIRTISRTVMCGALVSTLLVLAPTAHAADETSQRVTDLYKQANALYDQKKLSEAEALYVQAWNLKKSYDLACNLGAIELDLSKPRAAAEYLAYALREFPAGGKTSARVQIEGRLQKARSQVGTLRVHVSVPNARVIVAGQTVGSSPLANDVFVEPGSVTVEATLPGYETARQVTQVNKDSAAEITLTLERTKRSKLPVFVVGGVGLAALGIGGSFIGIAESKKSEAKALSIETNHACPVLDPAPKGKCKDLTSAASSEDTFGNIGIASMAVAGAAAIGVVTYLLWPDSHGHTVSARTLRVLPTASATSGGLFVVGSF